MSTQTVGGSSTSTSTVSENTSSNDSLSIGSGTSYVGGEGLALNVAGSNLAGSVGADITTNINTQDPAVVNAFSSAVHDQDQAFKSSLLALSAQTGTNPNLVDTSGQPSDQPPQDTSAPKPKINIVAALVVLAVVVILARS